MPYKTIMIRVELGVSNAAMLAAVRNLAARMEADVIGIAACQPIRIPFDDASLTSEAIAEDRAEIEKEMKAAETEFRTAMSGGAGAVEWRAAVTFGSLAEYVADQARAADLVVTGPGIAGGLFDTTRHVGVAELALLAGRPVLVVPHGGDLKLRHALVGWKGTRESRRVLADALPLLELAEKVSVVQIAPEAGLSQVRRHLADVQNWLARHGIAAEVQAFPAVGEDSQRLSEIARVKAADLIVAGAYGHSRLREWVLGGVTHDFLLHPDRCVLVSH